MPQRLGVLGGTFDPVHIGHLRVAQEALERFSLDRMLFVPSADPPHKPERRIVPYENRREMLTLAVEGNSRFEVSDVERRMPGKSYSVLTLRRLHGEMPARTDFFFMVGLDAFLELDTWWHFQELFSLSEMVVVRRPGFDSERVESFLRQKVSREYTRETNGARFRHPSLCPVHLMKSTLLEISSTQVRQLVAEGKSIRYLVLPEVMRYIEQRRLYRSVSLGRSEPEGAEID